jgi:hypothetical protein
MRSILYLPLVALAVSACESDVYVNYVPAPGFEQVMEASLALPDSGPVAVGQWVTLHATRRSGPWVLQDSTMTEDPPCEQISPVTEEFEVASKVEWRVEPPGQAAFNTPGAPDYDRQISFTEPGRYRLRAVSSGCGEPFESNVLEVVVE